MRVKFITLANLLWTDSIERIGMQVYNPDAPMAEPVPFPEYLTCQDKSQAMSQQLLRMLNDESFYQEQKRMLESLKDRYGQPGASARAADLLVDRFFSAENHSSEINQKPDVPKNDSIDSDFQAA